MTHHPSHPRLAHNPLPTQLTCPLTVETWISPAKISRTTQLTCRSTHIIKNVCLSQEHFEVLSSINCWVVRLDYLHCPLCLWHNPTGLGSTLIGSGKWKYPDRCSSVGWVTLYTKRWCVPFAFWAHTQVAGSVGVCTGDNWWMFLPLVFLALSPSPSL